MFAEFEPSLMNLILVIYKYNLIYKILTCVTFNLIYNAYAEIKDAKLTFIDLYNLQEHLRKNGIHDSLKHQTTIRIVSGKFGKDVKVSYKDFYNQLELCKSALQNYQHEIEVI